MATEKWTAGSGVGLTWTLCFSTSIDSLASGNAVQSTLAVSNGTALDIFADFTINLVSAAFATPNYCGVYLFPLNQDSSSYGNNQFAAAAAGPPPANYWVGDIGFGSTGTQVQVGGLTRIILPPGSFKFVLYNNAGIGFGTGNTGYYRTYNRSVA